MRLWTYVPTRVLAAYYVLRGKSVAYRLKLTTRSGEKSAFELDINSLGEAGDLFICDTKIDFISLDNVKEQCTISYEVIHKGNRKPTYLTDIIKESNNGNS